MEKGPNKRYIFVCTDSDCKKNGSKKLVKAISEELKARGMKAAAEVIKCKCMGHCKKGPNVVIDNQLYHQVKEKNLEMILAQCTFARV